MNNYWKNSVLEDRNRRIEIKMEQGTKKFEEEYDKPATIRKQRKNDMYVKKRTNKENRKMIKK